MKINRDKHINNVHDEIVQALNNIETLKGGEIFNQILETAVEWYETNNNLYYTFFKKAFPTTDGPIEFYEGLYSFLVNVLLDDSYYNICWEKYSDGDRIEGDPWVDHPYVIWANDDNGLILPDLMWKAMQYAIDKAKEREKWFEEDLNEP